MNISLTCLLTIALASTVLVGCQGEGEGRSPVTSAAASDCLPPAGVSDPDIAGAAGTIAGRGWCVSARTVAAGGRSFQVFDIDSGRRGPLHLVLHDDENASLPIALYAMERLGGRAAVIEAGERRRAAGVDPNRYFSNGRASAAGCPHGAPDPAFARAMLAGGGRSIIAYHSNDRGYSGDGRGGSGTISVRRQSASLVPFPAAGANEDDLILIAGRSATPSGGAARTVRALNAAGVNVVYEVVSPGADDCSVSNHLVLSGGGRYYNIEVGHGRVAAGRAMVDALARRL